jgi:hypothetical protein
MESHNSKQHLDSHSPVLSSFKTLPTIACDTYSAQIWSGMLITKNALTNDMWTWWHDENNEQNNKSQHSTRANLYLPMTIATTISDQNA